MIADVRSNELASADVELTPNEEALVSVLVEAAETERTVVRICGGWVRDKALGRVTKDVDVAVDNCTGAAFAEKVSKTLENRRRRAQAAAASACGDETTSENRSPPPSPTNVASKVGVIAANPDQSKHLETATMRLCGVEVDFVNLRSEAYADESSRVPTSVAFGTPLEDASRRDFTLNALMFNVHTRKIEDWTEKGWDDLRAGVLRTPLEPRVTLLDDPLRALRGVRFAARYSFRLDPALRSACRDPLVKHALLAKVSRERVGKEIKGALSTSASGAVRAVDELRRLDLASSALRAVDAVGYAGRAKAVAASSSSGGCSSGSSPGVECATVFSVGTAGATSSDAESPVWLFSARAVKAHAEAAYGDDATGARYRRSTAKETAPLAGAVVSLAVALSPFADCTALAKSKKKHAPVAVAVCRDGLKLPNLDVDAVHKLLHNLDRAKDLVRRYGEWSSRNHIDDDEEDDDGGVLRRDVGALLFDVKAYWRDVLSAARAVELASCDATVWGVATPEEEDDPLRLRLDAPKARTILDAYADFAHAVADATKFDLDAVWIKLRPFYDGNRLMRDLNVPSGPRVGVVLKEQRDFQLRHPRADQAACKAHLEAYLRDLGSKNDKDAETKKKTAKAAAAKGGDFTNNNKKPRLGGAAAAAAAGGGGVSPGAPSSSSGAS